MTTQTITIIRTLPASRETVFRAWTEPSELGWFFNPDRPTDIPTTVDLRPGGAWRQHMVIDEDTDYITGGVYLEIDPPRRLVFAFGAVGGWPEVDPDDLEGGAVATITLEEIDASTTRMTATIVVPETHWHPAMENGWTDTLDRLVEALGR